MARMPPMMMSHTAVAPAPDLSVGASIGSPPLVLGLVRGKPTRCNGWACGPRSALVGGGLLLQVAGDVARHPEVLAHRRQGLLRKLAQALVLAVLGVALEHLDRLLVVLDRVRHEGAVELGAVGAGQPQQQLAELP